MTRALGRSSSPTTGFFLSCLLLAHLAFRPALAAQTKSAPPATAPSATQEQEPPEEDPDLKPKVYAFNPLEAQRNITAGNFYYKKGNIRAGQRRYLEATKWDPTSQEALLRLAEADEKLHDIAGARGAYTKYLALDPPAKDAEPVKKKLEKLPDPHRKK